MTQSQYTDELPGTTRAADRGLVDRQAAVHVAGLSKRYQVRGREPIDAVVDVSFTVRPGEIFGILGPNGAGKTTILEMIEGLRSPTAGDAYIYGLDIRTKAAVAKEVMGVQLQASSYFDHLTLEEILDLFGSFYGTSREPAELLESVGLASKRRALVRTLSSGQSRRFSIIAALVNDPEVVFLDEPTSGLDPQARRNIWQLIEQVRNEQKTIVLTTHYMEEAQTLCDRVLLIDHGRMKALATPAALISEHAPEVHVRFHASTLLTSAELRAMTGVEDVTPSDGEGTEFELQINDIQKSLTSLLRFADERAITLSDLRVAPATLEDVFLNLTGRAPRE